MTPFNLDISPALIEVAVRQSVTINGFSATMVILASKGLIRFTELHKSCFCYEVLAVPKAGSLDNLEALAFGWMKERVSDQKPSLNWKLWWPQWCFEVEKFGRLKGLFDSENRSFRKKLFSFSILDSSIVQKIHSSITR